MAPALAIKFYVDGEKPVHRFVAKGKEFRFGNFVYLDLDLFGWISGVGMEGKCLAVHLNKNPMEISR